MDAFVTSTLPQKRQMEVNVNKEKSAAKKTRKYDSSYLNFGFTVTERKGVEHPKCVICCEVLATECMVPSKLKRHLTTNHSNLDGKPREFFARKLSEMNKQAVLVSNFLHTPAKAQLASFKVAYRIAKCKKPHTIAEELVLPAALDLVSTMLGESVAQELKLVPLSNNTICRRIDKIADDINDQLVAKMRENEFSLQLDEATTSSGNKDAYLICYVRFIDNDNNIIEDLLFCKPILTNCRAHELFAILNNFFLENNLEWKYCVGLCTDGARAMSGRFGGLRALVQGVAVNAKWTHCLIHREALASQKLSGDLNEVLEVVVKTVNFIKTRPLKARLFQRLCDELGADHNNLLFYCNARWLSKGKVLSRVYELRNEIFIFLKEENHTLATTFEDEIFLTQLAYLCDIFAKLNQLNVSLQGKDTHLLQLYDKITAFKRKLQLWKTDLLKNNEQCDSFPLLKSHLNSRSGNLSLQNTNECDMKTVMCSHLDALILHFEKYFSEDMEKHNWIRNPFVDNATALRDFTSLEAEQFIDLSSDLTLKSIYNPNSLIAFWVKVRLEFPLVSCKALRVLVPFATSYLCEAGFSAVAVIKSKYRNKIDIEREMRVAISNIAPRFDKMCIEQQAHTSH